MAYRIEDNYREKILFAAIQFYDTDEKAIKILEGRRHSEILQQMHERGIRYDRDAAIQGFTTNRGHFITREQGRILAENNGQLKLGVHTKNQLFSEDLW